MDVRVREPATPELDRRVREAAGRWRYRPWTQHGTALPFCHPVRITYLVE
jgi:hypothetical protein